MVTKLIRPVNFNPGRSQKLIKFEISSYRCSQIECNEDNDENEGYSALYIPLLPLRVNSEFDGNHLTVSCTTLISVLCQKEMSRTKELVTFSRMIVLSGLNIII